MNNDFCAWIVNPCKVPVYIQEKKKERETEKRAAWFSWIHTVTWYAFQPNCRREDWVLISPIKPSAIRRRKTTVDVLRGARKGPIVTVLYFISFFLYIHFFFLVKERREERDSNEWCCLIRDSSSLYMRNVSLTCLLHIHTHTLGSWKSISVQNYLIRLFSHKMFGEFYKTIS